MKKFYPIMVVLFFSSIPCQAQAKSGNLLSIDFSYALTGLLNQGWGIGVNYEKKLFDYLSVKGNFGHMTFLTGIEDVYNTSVSISVFANYYPFSKGFDKLYISVGGGIDFMNYFGKGELPHTAKDTLIHITPQSGWKFNPLEFLMIDVSIGYKFLVFDTQNYEEIKEYLNTGPRFGINIIVLLNRIKKNTNAEKGENNAAKNK